MSTGSSGRSRGRLEPGLRRPAEAGLGGPGCLPDDGTPREPAGRLDRQLCRWPPGRVSPARSGLPAHRPHRRAAGLVGSPPADGRLAGHAPGRRPRGRRGDISPKGTGPPSSGAEAIERLLRQYPAMDAVFVANDQMALSVMQAACQRGIAIPQDSGRRRLRQHRRVPPTSGPLSRRSSRTNTRWEGSPSRKLIRMIGSQWSGTDAPTPTPISLITDSGRPSELGPTARAAPGQERRLGKRDEKVAVGARPLAGPPCSRGARAIPGRSPPSMPDRPVPPDPNREHLTRRSNDMYRMKQIAFLFLVAAFVLGACGQAAPTAALRLRSPRPLRLRPPRPLWPPRRRPPDWPARQTASTQTWSWASCRPDPRAAGAPPTRPPSRRPPSNWA